MHTNEHEIDSDDEMNVEYPELYIWARKALDALGVDPVFTPYVIGMLKKSPSNYNNHTREEDEEDDEEDIQYAIYQLLMGWLPVSDSEKAQNFVAELVKYYENPSLLCPLEKTFQRIGSNTSFLASLRNENDLVLGDTSNGLKATAPSFIPPTFSSIPQQGTNDTLLQPLGDEYDYNNTSEYEFIPGQAINEPSVHEDNGYDQTEHNTNEVDDQEPEPDDEETFFWSFAYDLVSHLQFKFPDIDPNRLCDLLRLVGLDVDKAHAVLKATMEKEATGTTQVCRHYLQGDCRRADCMFLHDTHYITCRFWLRGNCLQHEDCVFAHDFTEFYTLDETTLRRDYDSEDEGEDSNTQVPLDFQAEEMFPALSRSVSTASSTSTLVDSHEKDLSLDFARAVTLQPIKTTPWSQSASALQGTSNGQSDLWGSGTPRLSDRGSLNRSMPARWVSTGSSVTVQYSHLREKAYQMACMRNKCFMGATQAYRNGNKALAKSLSQQGHDYNSKMKEYHYEAASAIFEARNPHRQIYRDQLMDLHGLHVAETVEFLSKMLPQLAEEGLEMIQLVTGSGHHSKGPNANARLRPAVERFLATEGYRYSPIADRRGFIGMLLVDLRW